MTDTYGSPLFAALREARAAEWEAYVAHDFVTRLGDGTLPREAFLTYLRQDYLFLVHFARAWALAAAKTDRIEEMRACAGTLHALIGEEMKLHIAICAREGIDEAALAAEPEAPETLAYTRYVIDAGLSGDLLDLLVALIPCVMGYGEIGRRLEGAAPGGLYAEWIGTYADPGYQQVCREVGALLEGVAARRLGPDPTASPRWPELAAGFGTACRLEADFWGMGLAAG
ncbi:MAG: thiaminase II [Rhodobacteraceae bacterium]|nr:thiaminase II [Paracoccaceae bacterium]MBR25622.1 thiaminase II [Paracoccaceae bacterium]